jgi:hypothetical protein
VSSRSPFRPPVYGKREIILKKLFNLKFIKIIIYFDHRLFFIILFNVFANKLIFFSLEINLNDSKNKTIICISKISMAFY